MQSEGKHAAMWLTRSKLDLVQTLHLHESAEKHIFFQFVLLHPIVDTFIVMLVDVSN
jgi:hypothetical protein